jgi:tRNA U34 5-carboxymethylaminomethyl modifying enzyme MnmG/GidA
MNNYGANVSTTVNKNILRVNKSTHHKLRKVNINYNHVAEKENTTQPPIYDIQNHLYNKKSFSMQTKIIQNTETNKIIIKRIIYWTEKNMTKKRIELQEFNID